MDHYHLTPEGSQWKLTGEGSTRTLARFGNKEEAVSCCTDMVGDRTGSLKIHNGDGTIEEERTYPRSTDPVKSPG